MTSFDASAAPVQTFVATGASNTERSAGSMTIVTKQMRNGLVLMPLIALILQGCVVKVNGTADLDVDSILGGVNVAEGARVGDVDSVNGGVKLRSNSQAGEVETVNGGIRIYDDVKVDSLEAVNGGIRAGENLRVRDGIETVNGRIDLGAGTTVGGDVSTVNGSIKLSGTEVGGNLQTTNGDIGLTSSRINGDVVFAETGRHFWTEKHHYPTLTVDAGSYIMGSIRLYQPVNLRIEDGATVGEVVTEY